MTGKNFLNEGRTLDRLGLKELTIPQIIKFAHDGEISAKSEEVVA